MKHHLLERYLNLHNKEEKTQYKEIIWDLLQSSYSNIGGYKGVSNPDELIETTSLWKLIKKNNSIVAFRLYKDQSGRKSVAAGTDGSKIGKEALIGLVLEDIKQQRSWGEVSGSIEHLIKKFDGRLIPSKYASFLTGKIIESYNEDGYHYTRLINGEPVEKILVGYPEDLPIELDETFVEV